MCPPWILDLLIPLSKVSLFLESKDSVGVVDILLARRDRGASQLA